MKTARLKLGQASAILETSPRVLENLVQFGILKPRRRGSQFIFDRMTLYAAKMALFLKSALGTNTELLSEFTKALRYRLPSFRPAQVDILVFKFRPRPGNLAVEVKVPFRQLAQQLEERLQRAELYKSLPRGRKRRGWKKRFFAALSETALEMGHASSEEALKTERRHRRGYKLKPEISVEAEPTPDAPPGTSQVVA